MPSTDAQSPGAGAPDAPRRRRRLLWALGAAGVVAAGLAIAASVLYEPWLLDFAKKRARAYGVDLEAEHAAYAGGGVRLTNARATLLGVRGLRADAQELRIDLVDFDPRAIHAAGVRIDLEGSATDLVLDATAWTARYAKIFRLPGSATGVTIAWAEASGAAPWLSLSGGALTASGAQASFRASMLEVGGVALGPTGALWTAEPARVSVGVGAESLDGAPIRADVHPMERPPSADLILRPIKLEALGAPLGLALPAPGALVEGKAHLVESTGPEHDLRGDLTMSVTGWVPPHPKELDGIVFGNRTSFTTKLEIPASHERVTLTDSAVEAGAFKLKGKGSLERRPAETAIHMDLSGSIPCTAIASSAASARIAGALGKIVAGVASKAVRGSVAVRVQIDAGSRDLSAAKIERSVGVGCGLHLP